MKAGGRMLGALAIGLLALLQPSTGLASTGITHALVASVSKCRAPVPASATVTNTLTLVVGGQDFPQLTSKTVVVVPGDWPGAESLRADPYGVTFRGAIGCLLPTDQSDFRAHAPTVTESNGSITVTDEVSTSRDPFWYDSYNHGSYNLGPWHIEPLGPDIKVSLANIPLTAFPAKWTICVKSGGLPAREWSTRPASDTSNEPNGMVAWGAQAGPAAAGTSLTLAWPSRFNLDQALGRWPLKTLTEAGWGTGRLVIFIPPLLLIRRYRRAHDVARDDSPSPEDHLVWRMRALRRVCIAGLVATVLIAVDDLVSDTAGWGVFTGLINTLYPGPQRSHDDIVAAFEVVALLLFSGWLFVSSWRWGRGIWWVRAGTALVIGLAWFVQVNPRLYSPTAFPIDDLFYRRFSLTRSAASAEFISVSLIPLLVIVFFTCAGTLGYILMLWPVNWKSLPWAPNPCGRTIVAGLAVVLAAACAIVAQVAYSAHYEGKSNGVLGNDNGIGNLDWMMERTLAVPGWFISQLPNLLFFPAAVGVLALLWHASRAGQRGIFFAGSSKGAEVRALAFLLAAVGMGTWGENVTLNLPIAFAVTYLLVGTVVVSNRLEVLESRLVVHAARPENTGTARRLVRYQATLLAAAERREGLQRKLKKLDEDASGPEAKDTASARQAVADELKRLTRKWELAETAPPTRACGLRPRWRLFSQRAAPMPTESIEVPDGDKGVNPGHAALSVGPEADWWANGWRAARLALLPSLVATAYYTYRAWHFGLLWPMDYRFGLVNDITQELSALASWLAIAFAFGCLFPYLRGNSGPIKGAVLGMAFAAGLAADAAPTYTLDAPRYNLFALDGIIDVVFLAVVGLLMDGQTLAHHSRNLSRVFELYHLSTFRVAATYSLTVVIALVGIWQQARIGNQLDQQRAQLAINSAKDLLHASGK